ncbi:peptidoglycan-binding protein [Herbiconiux liukaitaii]|uniref:peptidoglycan-binding protein n=1 Tax=Herbiconiux liukaitaii TaxID=3342799 RepID=UPI0035B7BF52
MSTQPKTAAAHQSLVRASVTPSNRPRRPRRTIVVAALGIVAVAAVAAALLVRGTASDEQSTAPAASTMSTVPVTTGDMVSATNARGTLHFSNENPLPAGPSGIVTALPDAGSVIAPGGVLYEIDDRPVLLLRGSVPAWRSFEIGMSDGDDVLQLEQNLTALGVPFSGDVDTTFTAATATAISSWQKGLGVERTGALDRTAILFTDHDLRVARPTAPLGAAVVAGAELYRVSATDKVVDIDLRLADQLLAVIGTQVGITLPDGTATTGSIASVGDPLERTAADGATSDTPDAAAAAFVVPVTIALTDQTAVAAFPRASVTVQFSSTLAESVLTVPVEALVATGADSFAVETPDGADEEPVRSIPVTVGAFASGRVQISGDGIREGLNVVVPES